MIASCGLVLKTRLEELCQKMECAFGVWKNITVPTQILGGKQQCVEITFLVAEPSDLQNVFSQNYRFRV